MNFGDALEALKQGKKITRSGWDGENIYLFLLEEAIVPIGWIKTEPLRTIAEQQGGTVKCLPSIRMLTAQGQVLTGWLPSATDMFAEDWIIVE